MPISEAVRVRGIGGTDISAIVGVNPWRDAFSVYAEKKGLLERTPPDLAMEKGTALEGFILYRYTVLTGREIELPNRTFQHSEYPFMVYTPDALVPGERRGVDAKYVTYYQRNKWTDGIPAFITLQCAWYMVALDYEAWDVAALIGDDDFRIYTVARDRELELCMLEIAEEFWRRYILGDEVPPVGGSEESRQWVNQHFPRNETDLVREALPQEIELLERYRMLRIREKELEPERVELENKLKAAIGDSAGVSWARGRFTWKTTESAGVDWKGLAGSILKAYGPEERAALEHEFTRPGVRRMHFRAEGL